jgi:hypothetical protein
MSKVMLSASTFVTLAGKGRPSAPWPLTIMPGLSPAAPFWNDDLGTTSRLPGGKDHSLFQG